MVEDSLYSNLVEDTLINAWTSHRQYCGARNSHNIEGTADIIATKEFHNLSKLKKLWCC